MGSPDPLKRKYGSQLRRALHGKDAEIDPISTTDYDFFKAAYLPVHLTLYERGCQIAEKVLKLSPDAKKRPKIEQALAMCHLNTSPEGVTSFSILFPLAFIAATFILTYMLPLALIGTGSFFFTIVAVLCAVGMIFGLMNLPFVLADSWRSRASNQMVLCIFYIVTYMRHTSNLERAIDFAAEHLSPPLSLDLKKVLWDVETEQYDSLKESLDTYLNTWRESNMEFIESMHLIEGSLVESSEERRLNALDKSLQVMLNETYERMLHYAHGLKGPITTLHMLGIILPILGLVILPLVVSFIPEVKWYHLMTFYNIVLPMLVFLLAKQIMAKRPTGYGGSGVGEEDPALKRMLKVTTGKTRASGGSPLFLGVLVFVVLALIGLAPLVLHQLNPSGDIAIMADGSIEPIPDIVHEEAVYYLLGYRNQVLAGQQTDTVIGPYGLGATLLSIFIPIALGLSFSIYYNSRSKRLMKIREQTRRLEQEFASALFQLGNRLGDGLPAEIAFERVADVMAGTESGRFFDLTTENIRKLGYGIEEAIFDDEIGSINYFPSSVIESSMKVLIESSKKGTRIASQAVINVSEYIKEMHRVDERLRDLMADEVSSMRSQVAFLTPVIAGIVMGITSMITKIIGNLAQVLNTLTASAPDQTPMAALLDIFGSGIPTYYFQIIVGVYIVEIAYLLSLLISGIENGPDPLAQRAMLGKNMGRSVLTYAAIAAVVILIFNFIAGQLVKSII